MSRFELAHYTYCASLNVNRQLSDGRTEEYAEATADAFLNDWLKTDAERSRDAAAAAVATSRSHGPSASKPETTQPHDVAKNGADTAHQAGAGSHHSPAHEEHIYPASDKHKHRGHVNDHEHGDRHRDHRQHGEDNRALPRKNGPENDGPGHIHDSGDSEGGNGRMRGGTGKGEVCGEGRKHRDHHYEHNGSPHHHQHHYHVGEGRRDQLQPHSGQRREEPHQRRRDGQLQVEQHPFHRNNEGNNTSTPKHVPSMGGKRRRGDGEMRGGHNDPEEETATGVSIPNNKNEEEGGAHPQQENDETRRLKVAVERLEYQLNYMKAGMGGGGGWGGGEGNIGEAPLGFPLGAAAARGPPWVPGGTTGCPIYFQVGQGLKPGRFLSLSHSSSSVSSRYKLSIPQLMITVIFSSGPLTKSEYYWAVVVRPYIEKHVVWFSFLVGRALRASSSWHAFARRYT